MPNCLKNNCREDSAGLAPYTFANICLWGSAKCSSIVVWPPRMYALEISKKIHSTYENNLKDGKSQGSSWQLLRTHFQFWLVTGTGSLRKRSWHQACRSSGSIWTMLLDIWFIFGQSCEEQKVGINNPFKPFQLEIFYDSMSDSNFTYDISLHIF